MRQPGIARWCREQANYFLNRVRSYGIEILGTKQLSERKKLPG